MSRWAFSIFMIFGMIGFAWAQAQPVQPQQQLTNPGQNSAERWVWNEMQAGRVANLHRHCNSDLDPDAGGDPRWRDPCRAISATFIERVLTQESWRSVLPFRGLRIIGAQVSEPLDLAAAHVSTEVWLNQSRFEQEVRFARARFDGLLSLNSSTFEGGIFAAGLQVNGSLLLDKATVRGELMLASAKIGGSLNLSSSTFEGRIFAADLQVNGSLYLLEKATVRGELMLAPAKIGGSLNLSSSTFEGRINAAGLQVDANLLMTDKAIVRGDLVLAPAKIGNLLYLSSSTFEGGINAAGLQVDANLLMTNKATVRGELVLASAKIGNLLDLSSSTFEGGINAAGLQVDAILLMTNKATVRGELMLGNAKIGGSLNLSSSTFEGGINAAGLQVDSGLSLRNAIFKQTPVIVLARIEGSLDLEKTELPGLDLAGTTIGELRLGGSQAPPTWIANTEQPSHLILRGTRTKVLLDHLNAPEPCPNEDAWPQQLDLQGFVYEQLGASPGSGTDMRERADCWYENWLGRDPHFAFQPYQHLAGVLRTAGDPDRADAVLSAARDRERTEAWTKGECSDPFKDWPWRRSDCWRAAGLGLLKVLIGYGIGGGLFLVFYWVLTFTLIGMLVLSFSPPARAKGPVWMFGASLDHLLPIVSLNKEFEDFFHDPPPRKRLKGWQLGYFAFHTLFGFLLGSFVVAALAGLTQTG